MISFFTRPTNQEKLATLRRLDPSIPDIYADIGRGVSDSQPNGFQPNGMTGMPDKLFFLPWLTAHGDYHDWTYHFTKFPRFECDEKLRHLIDKHAEELRLLSRLRMRHIASKSFSIVREVGKSHYDPMGLSQPGWSH